MDRVSALFRQHASATVLTGAQASEARFRQEAPGRRVVHLATHGYFLSEACAAGDVSPLLLSGLVLAGGGGQAGSSAQPGTGAQAGSSAQAGTGGQAGSGAQAEGRAGATPEGDDGILTAEEVAALDLGGVDLAVLSACDTGLGRVGPGEGVLGLRRAFEMAGARAVVMSLWAVPDRQARRWMTAFYTRWLDGTSIPEAARDASLDLLADLRAHGRSTHPYLWGGFATAGDWRGTGTEPGPPGPPGSAP